MEYFVSIENSGYFYWQIDLLLESFKATKVDGPIVAIAENNTSKKQAMFAKNIITHGNKFSHTNFGRERGYLPLNKPYAILLAIKNKLLSSHFAVLHPDMVLVNPLKEYEENIVFHAQPPNVDFKKHIDPYLEKIATDSKLKLKDFPPHIPLGGTMIFRDVKPGFFERVIARMAQLYREHGDKKFNIAKAAWTITIYEHLGIYSVKGLSIEKRLIDHEVEANLIHYCHGLPPIFSKRFYGFDDFQMMIDPYKVLLEYNPSDATDYVQKLVRSYQSK